jgi:hypothetical protein
LQPIREQVVIATKFGFDIDLETGKRGPGTNSRPEHIKAVADACLNPGGIGTNGAYLVSTAQSGIHLYYSWAIAP